MGDLKRVMTNVRTRGTWGEVQLGAIIEGLLTAEQFAKNVKTVPGSNDLVEYAIKMPGKSDDQPIWLPIDCKYPVEHYQRPIPDGHPKLLHLWPVKLLQAGRSDYDYVGVMAMREAASFRR